MMIPPVGGPDIGAYAYRPRPVRKPGSVMQGLQRREDATCNKVTPILPIRPVRLDDPAAQPPVPASAVEQQSNSAPKTAKIEPTPATFGPVEKLFTVGAIALVLGTLVWVIGSVIVYNMR